MSESITVRTSAIPDAMTSSQIIALLNQVLSDIANLRTSINAHQHQVTTSAASGTWTTTVSSYSQQPTSLLP
jgi:hypothetical protein